MKTSKTTGHAKKTEKLELAKETVRSLQVKSDVHAGLYQLGNGGAGGVHSAPRPTTGLAQCN